MPVLLRNRNLQRGRNGVSRENRGIGHRAREVERQQLRSDVRVGFEGEAEQRAALEEHGSECGGRQSGEGVEPGRVEREDWALVERRVSFEASADVERRVLQINVVKQLPQRKRCINLR